MNGTDSPLIFGDRKTPAVVKQTKSSVCDGNYLFTWHTENMNITFMPCNFAMGYLRSNSYIDTDV